MSFYGININRVNYSHYIILFVVVAFVTLSVICLTWAVQFVMILTGSSTMLLDLTIFIEYIVLFPIYLLDSSFNLDAGIPLKNNLILLQPLFWGTVAVVIEGCIRKRARHNQSSEKDAEKKRSASQL